MPNANGDKVIDLHAHVVLEEGFGQAGEYGPEPGIDEDGIPYFRFGGYSMKPMAYPGTVFMDVDLRLEAMEKHGIDLQLLSPNPLTMFHHIPAKDAINFCQVQNDAMANLVGQHQGVLMGAACLPMQDVDASLTEMDRAVKELGLPAIHIGTNLPFNLDDPRMDGFYARIVELDVPLFMHPASSGGLSGPDDPRLERFDMTIVLGYAYEETVATSQLVLGGVLDRHPDIDICISHGGGAMAFLIPRFEGMAAIRDWAPDSVKEHGFLHVLKKLWFDAHVHGAEQNQMMVDLVGADRCVYGTNFGGWDTPSAADDFAASLTPNAEKLMRLT